MPDQEDVEPYIVGKWAGQDNYECNVVENGINCPYDTLNPEHIREHLTGHGIYLEAAPKPGADRPRFRVGFPVPDRDAEETKAPPPEPIVELAPPAEVSAEPATRRRRQV